MAQRKRNIEFSRPDEPSFLKKLKSQLGFQNDSIEDVETKVGHFSSLQVLYPSWLFILESNIGKS